MIDRTTFFSFMAGGVTGAGLALLLAPQSGHATRGRIGRKVRDTADSALEMTDRLVQRGEEIGDEAARRVQEAGSALAGHAPRKTHANGDEATAT